MKKIIALTLLLCMALTFAACGTVEITMQEIYNAGLTEAMLKNHQSVYICDKTEGKIWREIYLTKDYAYDYIPDEEFPLVKFITDDACYYDNAGDMLVYLFMTPDGVGNFASERAKTYASVTLDETVLYDRITSVGKKDGRITVTSVLSDKTMGEWAEFGMTAGQYEYVLDAATREMISFTSDHTYDDGSVSHSVAELRYDAEAPEMLKKFLGYVNQTEDLRGVTLVSNPGLANEKIESVQVPKGLIVGFQYDDNLEGAVAFYTDAACTESYDPYADTDSDLTVYVQWTNA